MAGTLRRRSRTSQALTFSRMRLQKHISALAHGANLYLEDTDMTDVIREAGWYWVRRNQPHYGDWFPFHTGPQLRDYENHGQFEVGVRLMSPDEGVQAVRAEEREAGEPTEQDFEKHIKPIWLKTKPSREAQGIRSSLSVEFDDPRFKQWMSDFAPEYVWDLVDIAAQRGINLSRRVFERQAEYSAHLRDLTFSEERLAQLREEIAATDPHGNPNCCGWSWYTIAFLMNALDVKVMQKGAQERERCVSELMELIRQPNTEWEERRALEIAINAIRNLT